MNVRMAIGLALAASAASALDRYVALDGGNQPPYTNWAMAAADLRAAVQWANTNNAGDTVWVSNGTHALTVPVIISNATVRGFGPADQVIVSGGGVTQCFLLRHANACLTGLTVSNGYNIGATLYRGGAVTLEAGLVSNAVIGWSYALYGGGVMFRGATAADALLANCLVVSNRVSTYGGGVAFFGTSGSGNGTLRDCTIVSNAATLSGARGGGICTYSMTEADIRGCVVRNNTCSNDGGGLYLAATGTARVWACVFQSNLSYGAAGGGGIDIASGTTNADIRRTICSDNTANIGAGMSVFAGTVSDCLLARNLATNTGTGGGGVYCRYTSDVYNCTFVANTANRGSGIYAFDSTVPATFRNCVIYGNSTTSGTSTNEVDQIGSNRFFHCTARRWLSLDQQNIRPDFCTEHLIYH